MADWTVPNLLNILKIIYRNGLDYALYERDPYLKWVMKSTTFGGEDYRTTAMYTGIHGSTNITNARNRAAVAQFARFVWTRFSDYNPYFLDLEGLRATRGQPYAQASSVKTSMDAALEGMAMATLHQCFGNGGGSRGQGDGLWTVTGNLITLSDQEDIVHFEPGLTLEFSIDDGVSGAAGVRVGTVTVAKVNRKDGTIETVEPDISVAVPGVTNLDFIYRADDYQDVMSGVLAHVPPTEALAATTFKGVDRSIDTERLAGTRVDLTNASTIEGLIEMCGQAGVSGAKITTLWMHHLRIAELMKEEHGKTLFVPGVTKSAGGEMNVKCLIFASPQGPLPVMATRGLKSQYILGITEKTYRLHSLGKYPHVSDEHGSKFLPTTRDAIEGRIKRYAEHCCESQQNQVLGTFS